MLKGGCTREMGSEQAEGCGRPLRRLPVTQTDTGSRVRGALWGGAGRDRSRAWLGTRGALEDPGKCGRLRLGCGHHYHFAQRRREAYEDGRGRLEPGACSAFTPLVWTKTQNSQEPAREHAGGGGGAAGVGAPQTLPPQADKERKKQGLGDCSRGPRRAEMVSQHLFLG